MRKIGTINFINTFFYAGLALAIPLYLIKKGINVEEIGFILSVIPFFMLILRTVAAIFSETFGSKIFFSLQGIAEIIASLIYMVASSPLMFAFAKAFEGVSYSFFWAVDRTAIFEDAMYNKKDKGIEAATMVAVRMIGGMIGIIIAAFVIMNFSFEYFFLLLCLLGLVTLLSSMALRDTSKRSVDVSKIFDIIKMPKFFRIGLALGLNFPAASLMLFFAIPVFAKLNLSADYITIGIVMALFYGSIGIGSFIGSKMRLDERKLLFPELLGVPMFFLLPFFKEYFIPMLVFAGISYGISASIFEELLSKTVDKTKYVSSAVALLHVPGRVIEFFVLFSAGIIYTVIGSWAPFVLAGLMFGISAIMFDRYLNGG